MFHSQTLVNKIMSRDFYSYQVSEDVTKRKNQKPPVTSDDLYEVTDFDPLNDITNFKTP